MYLIRDIDIVEIPEEDLSTLYSYSLNDNLLRGLDPEGNIKDLVAEEEIVRSRIFRQCKSPEECIKISLGISKKARELLGLEESHFQNMEKLVWDLREKDTKREQSILEFDNSNRFKKAWWMLIGKKLTRGFE